MNVLILEDDKEVSSMYGEILRDIVPDPHLFFFESVDSAASGYIAIRPEIMLVDNHVCGEKTGLEFLSSILPMLLPQKRLILMTSSNETLKAYQDIYFDVYVGKDTRRLAREVKQFAGHVAQISEKLFH